MAEWIVELLVYGAFSGQVAARQAGLEATRTWDLGDLVLPDAQLRFKSGGFAMASARPSEATLEEHLDDLLSRVPEPSALRAVEPEPEWLKICCALYLAPDESPEIYMRPDQLQRIAALGAAFDIDLYPDYLEAE